MEQLAAIAEALLFTSDKPLPLKALRDKFAEHERPELDNLRQALSLLTERYASSALMLTETASGYRFVVKDEYASWVVRSQAHKVPRYSRAVLETLAIIAYRQPVTRADVEAIRGVAVSSGVMRTLVDHGWVKVVGHREVPGRPALHATTKTFLDEFGLKRLDELPSLAQVKYMTEEQDNNSQSGAQSNVAAGEDSANSTSDANDSVAATANDSEGKNQPTQAKLPLQETAESAAAVNNSNNEDNNINNEETSSKSTVEDGEERAELEETTS